MPNDNGSNFNETSCPSWRPSFFRSWSGSSAAPVAEEQCYEVSFGETTTAVVPEVTELTPGAFMANVATEATPPATAIAFFETNGVIQVGVRTIGSEDGAEDGSLVVGGVAGGASSGNVDTGYVASIDLLNVFFELSVVTDRFFSAPLLPLAIKECASITFSLMEGSLELDPGTAGTTVVLGTLTLRGAIDTVLFCRVACLAP